MNLPAVTTKAVSLLLVEDDDVDVMGFERALRKQKILNPLIRAKDGVEALAILRNGNTISHSYMILLDLNLPRMNGIEFLAELRQDSALAGSVVFVLTTSKADQDIAAAYQKQVAGYIVKSQAGPDFMHLIELLDRYWRIVELPAHG